MHIAGFKESSLNEWEGYVTSIIWTAGCNWRCAYCHAKNLILEPEKIEQIEESIVFDYIKGKKGWVDGLCISGGEPTLQPDLIEFIKRARELDISIKLETNGSKPNVLRELVKDGLIECLCLDFKQILSSPLLNITRQAGHLYDVFDSFNIAFGAEIETEFHTTLCPAFINKDSIGYMGEFLHNKGLWVLQQYDPKDVLNPDRAGDKIYSEEEAEELRKEAQKYHENVILKNI